MGVATHHSPPSVAPFSPVGPLLSDTELLVGYHSNRPHPIVTSPCSATRAKLLRMERDYHELKCDFDMFKKRSERAGSELENTNKKLNTQIHNHRKEYISQCAAELFL